MKLGRHNLVAKINLVSAEDCTRTIVLADKCTTTLPPWLLYQIIFQLRKLNEVLKCRLGEH